MDSKLRDLLQAALEKTQKGNLKWHPFDSEAFRAHIGGGHIHVQRSIFDDATQNGTGTAGAYKYAVQVSNPFGQVVAEEEAIEGGVTPDLPLLKGLFLAARTSGLGGYEVLDHMLRTLQVTP